MEVLMRLKVFAFLSLVFVIVGFLSGCSCFTQQQKGETPPPPAPEAVVVAPEEAKEMPVAVAPPEKPLPPPPAPAPMVMLKDINFDFNKYNIRSGDGDILKQNMDWFKANPGQKVKVEGNCDERGTVEYNLVLGQKRADSGKNHLTNLGVDGKLLETVSYGKEKPICQEHNEDCWAKNRRVHFEPVK
jgi:peptidoglycan-associated lipoprotein